MYMVEAGGLVHLTSSVNCAQSSWSLWWWSTLNPVATSRIVTPKLNESAVFDVFPSFRYSGAAMYPLHDVARQQTHIPTCVRRKYSRWCHAEGVVCSLQSPGTTSGDASRLIFASE